MVSGARTFKNIVSHVETLSVIRCDYHCLIKTRNEDSNGSNSYLEAINAGAHEYGLYN